MTDVVRSASRVLELLEYFSGLQEPRSLASVAAHFSLPKTSALALLRTLTSRGYLIREERTGTYSFNEALRDRGFGRESGQLLKLMSLARSHMDALSLDLQETVLLGALTQDGNVCLVMQALSAQTVRYEATLGALFPAHCSAMGRAILTDMNEPDLRDFLSLRPLQRFTDRTVTELEDVVRLVAVSKLEGFAVISEEFDPGGTGIAVPLHGADGSVVAALNVACVSARYAQKEALIKAGLLSTARTLEQLM